MVLLFGGINSCADDENYRTLYEVSNSNSFVGYGLSEFGFAFLAFLSNKIGLTYELFRTLISIIGLILLLKTVTEYSNKYNTVFLLYFIYPFMMNVIQIRNFLAAAIIVYSIRFLIQNSKIGDIKFLIGILIAFSIHYASIFFIPFIFLKKYSIKQLIVISLISVPILCGLTKSNIIPNLIGRIVGEGHMFNLESFFQKGHWGFILSWIKQFSIFILCYSAYTIIQKSNLDEKWKILDNIIIKLNIFLIIICFPLMIFNTVYFRLCQDILILNYIIIGHLLYINPKKGYLYFTFAILLGLCFLGDEILYDANFYQVLIPFFQSNSIL